MAPTPHPLRRPIVRRQLRRVLRVVRRLELHIERHVVPPVNSDRLAVSVVDDPTGRMRLIGVRGPVNVETVVRLATVLDAVEPGSRLHLDLTDATIAGPLALEHVERLVDRLELRGVRIRIVGLDPRHPALGQQRSR